MLAPPCARPCDGRREAAERRCVQRGLQLAPAAVRVSHRAARRVGQGGRRAGGRGGRGGLGGSQGLIEAASSARSVVCTCTSSPVSETAVEFRPCVRPSLASFLGREQDLALDKLTGALELSRTHKGRDEEGTETQRRLHSNSEGELHKKSRRRTARGGPSQSSKRRGRRQEPVVSRSRSRWNDESLLEG